MDRFCKNCKETKSLDNFEKFRHQCKTCRKNKRNTSGKRAGLVFKDYRLNYMYGISLEVYDLMKVEQNHVCKICKKPGKNQWGNVLVVDHCHKTGKVRGLLCDKCNRGLGQFLDDIELLKKAISYLKE